MTKTQPQPASPFVVEWIPRLARLLHARTALDLACGTGRHSRVLAQHDFDAFAVDKDIVRIRALQTAARAEGWPVHAWVADLRDMVLPAGRFDVVLGTRYLQRDLWPALRRAVKPGGFLVYETYTVDQLARGWGPRSADYLLHPTELRDIALGWPLEYYSERDDGAALARLVARRPR